MLCPFCYGQQVETGVACPTCNTVSHVPTKQDIEREVLRDLEREKEKRDSLDTWPNGYYIIDRRGRWRKVPDRGYDDSYSEESFP